MTKHTWWMLAALALAALSCATLPDAGTGSATTGGDHNGGPGHFENDEIAFDYPADWDTGEAFFPDWQPGRNSEYDAEVVAAVAKLGTDTPFEKYTVSCSVMRRDLPDGPTLEDVMAETYAGMYIEQVISEGAVNVAGTMGYERVYTQYHGEPLWQVRETWVEIGGMITIIRCASLPNQFEASQADFDVILSSLVVR